jgi:hypothetical protein
VNLGAWDLPNQGGREMQARTKPPGVNDGAKTKEAEKKLSSLTNELAKAKAAGDKDAVARLQKEIDKLKPPSAASEGAPAFAGERGAGTASAKQAVAAPAFGSGGLSFLTGSRLFAAPATARFGAFPSGQGAPFTGGSPMGQGDRERICAAGNSQLPNGPAGRVGNIDVGRLVSVVPKEHRQAANQHFPGIVAEAQQQGVSKPQLAYILATTVHESRSGASMEEFDCGSRYQGRADLGNFQAGDGRRFKGRGYVQITGRRNYTDWSRRLGEDLLKNPKRATEPRLAAKILVGGMKLGTFTGRRLDQFINDRKTDFVGARQIVNGNDRARHIGSIAERLLRAMS